MVGAFTGTASINKAGGALGIVTAAIAYYCGTAQLLTPENSLFTLPLGPIKKND